MRIPSSVTFSPKRSSLVLVGFLGFAAVLAYEFAEMLIAGEVVNLEFIILALVVAGIAVAILKNWRNGVYFLLVWLLFEDFARKFLGNNMAIYFAKDFLVLLIYLSFFASWRRKDKRTQVFRPPFLWALLLLVWFGAMQVFNPGSNSIFYGLMGMKIYFYYIPLVLVGYAMIDSDQELRRFFYVNLGFMSVIAVLGIIQSIVGPTFLSPPVLADDIRLLSQTYRIAPISGVIVYRPTSVFVSTGRFANMLIVSWLLAFGFSGYLLLRRRQGRAFAFVALTIIAAACVMASSRGVMMWCGGAAVVGAAAFLWGAPWKQGHVLKVFRSLQRAAIGIALALTVLMFTYPQALLDRLAVYTETLNPDSPSSELLYRARDYPVENFFKAFNYDRWFYGYGIGTASLGGQYVSRILHVPSMGIGVESGFGNLILEMGVGGLLLWLMMSMAVTLSAWKVARSLKGSPWFPLAFMIFLYAFLLLLPITFTGLQSYQDFVLNAYLWLLLGVLFRLPKIALSAQDAAIIHDQRQRFAGVR